MSVTNVTNKNLWGIYGEILMENNFEVLKACPLFSGLSTEEISNLLKENEYLAMSYIKNQFIAVEDEICNSIGIVIEGSIEVKKISASGNSLTITSMKQGNIFGEMMVFADTNRYPSSIISADDTTILFISQQSIIKMCTCNNRFLQNLMKMLSNKLLVLNSKIKYLSYQTIRQKVASYILDIYHKEQKSLLKLNHSRKEMAEFLNIPRPSLSRELENMKKEGLIDYDKAIIKILNLNSLKKTLV